MKLFPLLFVFMVFVTPSPVAAAGVCPDLLTTPQFHVTVSSGDVRFDTTKTAEDLISFNPEPGKLDPNIYHVMIGAVMAGNVSVQHLMRFREASAKDWADKCIWFDRADITLRLDPVIYIASEYSDRACEFKELLEHEIKHVDLDRAIMEEFISLTRQRMMFAFPSAAEAMKGPLPPAREAAAKAELESHLQGAIQAIMDQLMQRRIERQASLDTAWEYYNIARACR